MQKMRKNDKDGLLEHGGGEVLSESDNLLLAKLVLLQNCIKLDRHGTQNETEAAFFAEVIKNVRSDPQQDDENFSSDELKSYTQIASLSQF